jgi:hypothetical protein
MAYERIDWRGEVPVQPWSNIGAREKDKGVVVHYAGLPTGLGRGGVSLSEQVANEVHYQMTPGLYSPGFTVNGMMYHFVVWEDSVYQVRDENAKLWHAADGTAEDSWNYSAFSVHVPIGEGQQASARMIQTLQEFCDDLLGGMGLGRDRLKGHQEISNTACPGTLMDDFVRPYRVGGVLGPHEPPIKPVRYNLCASEGADVEGAKVAEVHLKSKGIAEVQVVTDPGQIRHVSDGAYSTYPVGTVVAIYVGKPRVEHVTLEARRSFELDWDTSDNWSCAGDDLEHTKKLVADALKEIWTRECTRLHDLLVVPPPKGGELAGRTS